MDEESYGSFSEEDYQTEWEYSHGRPKVSS